MTVEELNVVITAQNREFNEALNGVINRLDDMDERTQQYGDSAVGMFKKVASAAAALGIGKIISDSIMNAGELEQNLGGAEVVFQKSADSMKSHAKTAFQDMGLSESGYLATANKMGALLKGTGMDAASAAAMSQQAMQRAADVASIMGIDTASAMEAVTGAAKGNFTMMDNLGVAINDTTLQIYAQEHGLGKLETTQQKVNAAMQMFFEKTEYAAGNYARENDTFSGSLTTFKAELDNLTADLGTELLPVATDLLEMARDGLEFITPVVKGIGKVITGIYQSVKLVFAILGLTPDAGAAEEMQKTADGADAAADSTDRLADSYKGLGAGAESAKKSLADIDTLNVFGGSANTGGIDFGAVVEGAEEASDAVQGASDELDGASGKIDDLNNLSLDGLGSTIMTTFENAGKGLSLFRDAFNFDSETQLESLRTLNEKVRQLFGDDWVEFWGDVGSTMYSAFGEHGNEYERQQVLTEIGDWLAAVNDKLTWWLGSYKDEWTQFWMDAEHNSGGFGFHAHTQGNIEEYYKSLETSYSDMVQVIENSIYSNLRQGMSPEDALILAKKEYFDTHEAAENLFNQKDYGDLINIHLAYEFQKDLIEWGQLSREDASQGQTLNEDGTYQFNPRRGGGSGGRIRNADGTYTSVTPEHYEYTDYSRFQQAPPTGYMQMLSPNELTAQMMEMEKGSTINLNLNLQTEVDLDGTRVGESVTEYQTREAARGNGY